MGSYPMHYSKHKNVSIAVPKQWTVSNPWSNRELSVDPCHEELHAENHQTSAMDMTNPVILYDSGKKSNKWERNEGRCTHFSMLQILNCEACC